MEMQLKEVINQSRKKNVMQQIEKQENRNKLEQISFDEPEDLYYSQATTLLLDNFIG